ncbi:hypothetical protein V1291_001046 [Nitrobacteraceae bacterium AZCC 1564]
MTLSGLGFNLRHFRGGALAAAIFVMAPAVVHADSAPFANFAGNWSGNGTISIAEGGTERIRCRGTYTVDGSGNNLHQVLRCASDSYKFELTSDVAASGSNISGSWNEASRGINGSIQGSVANGQINALVQTNGYAATFNVVTRGNKQSVNISSKGELRGVNITLARGN